MKKFITQTLAVALIAACFSIPVHAQEGMPSSQPAPSQSTPMQPAPATSTPKAPKPCATERHNVLSACRNKPCTPTCMQAHQAMKACRAANNLPPPKPKKQPHGHPCKAPGSAAGATTTGATAPTAPPSGDAAPPASADNTPPATENP